MIVLLALFFSLGAIFYSLEAFKEAKNYYNYTLKLYLKQSLSVTNDSLIPIVLKKAQEIYQENPYNPYYKESMKVEDISIKLLIKDDNKFNINSIKNPIYFNVFKSLSEEFCMPKDFPYYVYYWITGKNKDNIDLDALTYEAPFRDMQSKEEIIYATPYSNLLYKNNCHSKKQTKGIWYFLDTKNQSLNINTIPIPILKALNKDITESTAKEIIDYINLHPIKNIEDLVNIRGLSLDDIYKIQSIVSTKSSLEVIKIISKTKMGGITQRLTTKVYYSPPQNKILGIYQY
ncbi:MAG: helix-hairpin-helix domain-containing protein [Hydrogenobaculum sp.]